MKKKGIRQKGKVGQLGHRDSWIIARTRPDGLANSGPEADPGCTKTGISILKETLNVRK